jgi:mutual gliding-motility protein MglA
VLLSPERRELAIKLVYYGPALSGKTTNLKRLHAHAAPEARGRLMSLETEADRTLFFDLLPLHLRAGNVTVKIRIYTVPGQVMHNATRKVVLAGVDGVAFIADSRVSEMTATNEAFHNLKENLRENGLEPETVPIVLQFNKRDLPGGRSDEELARLETRARPVYVATALRDEGVLRTFLGLLAITWDDLEKRHALRDQFGVARDEILGKVKGLFKPV